MPFCGVKQVRVTCRMLTADFLEKIIKSLYFVLSVSLLLMALASPAMAAKQKFFLKSGDRVCFCGDSITEQRFYPADVQTHVLTRFPNLHVRFVDAGVGGDRVGGGWAGPINVRLKRDVYPFKPNVITIMLAMNDAGYRPFNKKLYNTLYHRV
jgi:lysophospholipase L1-like esterase